MSVTAHVQARLAELTARRRAKANPLYRNAEVKFENPKTRQIETLDVHAGSYMVPMKKNGEYISVTMLPHEHLLINEWFNHMARLAIDTCTFGAKSTRMRIGAPADSSFFQDPANLLAGTTPDDYVETIAAGRTRHSFFLDNIALEWAGVRVFFMMDHYLFPGDGARAAYRGFVERYGLPTVPESAEVRTRGDYVGTFQGMRCRGTDGDGTHRASRGTANFTYKCTWFRGRVNGVGAVRWVGPFARDCLHTDAKAPPALCAALHMLEVVCMHDFLDICSDDSRGPNPRRKDSLFSQKLYVYTTVGMQSFINRVLCRNPIKFRRRGKEASTVDLLPLNRVLDVLHDFIEVRGNVPVTFNQNPTDPDIVWYQIRRHMEQRVPLTPIMVALARSMFLAIPPADNALHSDGTLRISRNFKLALRAEMLHNAAMRRTVYDNNGMTRARLRWTRWNPRPPHMYNPQPRDDAADSDDDIADRFPLATASKLFAMRTELSRTRAEAAEMMGETRPASPDPLANMVVFPDESDDDSFIDDDADSDDDDAESRRVHNGAIDRYRRELEEEEEAEAEMSDGDSDDSAYSVCSDRDDSDMDDSDGFYGDEPADRVELPSDVVAVEVPAVIEISSDSDDDDEGPGAVPEVAVPPPRTTGRRSGRRGGDLVAMCADCNRPQNVSEMDGGLCRQCAGLELGEEPPTKRKRANKE
jgi:hypothetical protein